MWLADITYVRTWSGFCYVAFVEDAFSRMVVGWSIATHLRTSLATEALEMARDRESLEAFCSAAGRRDDEILVLGGCGITGIASRRATTT